MNSQKQTLHKCCIQRLYLNIILNFYKIRLIETIIKHFCWMVLLCTKYALNIILKTYLLIDEPLFDVPPLRFETDEEINDSLWVNVAKVVLTGGGKQTLK